MPWKALNTFAIPPPTRPWNFFLNPSIANGSTTNLNGVEVAVTPGTTIKVEYLSGSIKVGLAFPPTPDAAGYPPIGSGSIFGPSIYVVGTLRHGAGGVLGCFVNSGHIAVGSPLSIGNNTGRIAVPFGATKLSLGVDDEVNFYGDNLGIGYTMKISQFIHRETIILAGG